MIRSFLLDTQADPTSGNPIIDQTELITNRQGHLFNKYNNLAICNLVMYWPLVIIKTSNQEMYGLIINSNSLRQLSSTVSKTKSNMHQKSKIKHISICQDSNNSNNNNSLMIARIKEMRVQPKHTLILIIFLTPRTIKIEDHFFNKMVLLTVFQTIM